MLLAGVTGCSSASRRATTYPHAFGVYAGPGAKGVAGASGFDAAMQAHSSAILDFAADDGWYNLTGPSWLLDPHSGDGRMLEYSLPLFPSAPKGSLEQCAAGSYDDHWQTLASNLVAARLADTIVRPGWEFNGDWYRWSAAGHPAAFAECFRHVVTAMRSVTGGHFAFDWNANIGPGELPAESAYPGDGFVDYIGVDVYDVSGAEYSNNVTTARQRAAVWAGILRSDHGLEWWAAFAGQHRKPLAVPEWGVAHLADGHGGGDDPDFIRNMLDFMADPVHRVAYEHYFDTGTPQGTHALTGATLFPDSARQLRSGLRALFARR